MTIPTSLRDLEKRLSEASGPDRELDAAIAIACGISSHTDITSATGCGCTPYYTKSIDAAVALCERALPDWHLIIRKFDSDYGAQLTQGPGQYLNECFKSKPALALCLAITRALIAQSEVQE